MEPYRNRSGKSGVIAYQIGSDEVHVQFPDGIYTYNFKCPGRADVEQMKRLARAGRGLATYISRHVRSRYASKKPLKNE
jgi:hypothetical protein